MDKLTVANLRGLFKGLEVFRALYESDGLDTVTFPDGTTYSLWDIENLYKQRFRLSTRQRQSIECFLVANIRECDVAVMMNVSPNNPVASYATHGLEKLIKMVEAGEVPGFRLDVEENSGREARTESTVRNRPQPRRGCECSNQAIAGGCNLHLGKVGYFDSLEGARPIVTGGVHEGGVSGRVSQTWHVSPGVQRPAAAPEFSEWQGTRTARPKSFSRAKNRRNV